MELEYTHYVLDVVFGIIILIGLIIGIKKGFISIVSKPIKIIAAIAISISFATPVGTGIIQPYIQEPITDAFAEQIYENCPDISAETTADDLPTILKLVATVFNVEISEDAENADDAIHQIAESFATPVVNAISIAVGFVVLIVASSVILSLAFMLLNSVFNSGPLAIINRALGAILMVIFALIICWVIISIAGDKLPFQGGFIYDFFKNKNPMELILQF
jgi:uncharacterized membrane protein required for colicin V production